MAGFGDLGLSEYFTTERVMALIQAVVILILGLAGARIIAATVTRAVRKRATPQGTMILRRAVFYTLFVLVFLLTLHQLGIQLGVLLGAAGILTVAIGFASQTSASNIISGLFLLAERPFVVGDIITIESKTGEVLSIDALSVKLRTFDNLLIRVPNETIVKTTLTNLTHFPIRRLDLKLGVAYREDLPRVQEILLEVADRNPLCLTEPKPLYIFTGFGDSALEIQFSVWAKRENFLECRNSIQHEIKAAFDENGIEIPFPHRTLYAGSETDPFPVKVVDQKPPS